MFKTDSFLGNKKLSFNQNVYLYGKQCCLSALELFHCLPPLFCCLPQWKTVRLHGKKLQNATNNLFKFSAQDSDLEYLCWRRKNFFNLSVQIIVTFMSTIVKLT